MFHVKPMFARVPTKVVNPCRASSKRCSFLTMILIDMVAHLGSEKIEFFDCFSEWICFRLFACVRFWQEV